MEYNIRNCGGHVEVSDSMGHFLFSADTEHEAHKEIFELEISTNLEQGVG